MYNYVVPWAAQPIWNNLPLFFFPPNSYSENISQGVWRRQSLPECSSTSKACALGFCIESNTSFVAKICFVFKQVVLQEMCCEIYKQGETLLQPFRWNCGPRCLHCSSMAWYKIGDYLFQRSLTSAVNYLNPSNAGLVCGGVEQASSCVGAWMLAGVNPL